MFRLGGVVVDSGSCRKSATDSTLLERTLCRRSQFETVPTVSIRLPLLEVEYLQGLPIC
jgi:hypothetical protein